MFISQTFSKITIVKAPLRSILKDLIIFKKKYIFNSNNRIDFFIHYSNKKVNNIIGDYY